MKKISLKKSKMFDRYICKKEFHTVDDDNNKKYQKVRYYCYYIGRFRGAAHSIYNLRYKTPKKFQ